MNNDDKSNPYSQYSYDLGYSYSRYPSSYQPLNYNMNINGGDIRSLPGSMIAGSISGHVVSANNPYALKQHQLSRQNSSSHYRSKVALANSKPETNQSKEENLFTQLDIGGVGVKVLSPGLFEYDFLTHLYINHNNLMYLSDSISNLNNLVKLDVSGNKLVELPGTIGKLVKLKELLAFDNSIVFLPMSMGFMFKLKFLGLENNPLNEPLKSLLESQGTQPTIKYIRDNAEPPAPPKSRRWNLIQQLDKNNSFKVMSYNILSEKYATSSQYGYTADWCLAWEYRKDIIMQEIMSYEADIICLQEIEKDQFEEYFKPKLQEYNYIGLFWSKTRAKLMQEKEKGRVDGCATFYKKNKFKVLHSQIIEFSSVAMLNQDFMKTDDLFNRFLNKDNISGAVVLEINKETMNNSKNNISLEKNKILISNVHLHWDPEYCDVKVLQAAMLTGELEKITKDHNTNHTLICGDFNSLPDSGVCSFLENGYIEKNHKDLKNFEYGKYTENGIRHCLNIKSAYDNSDLLFTNYTPNFTGTIDYIYYTPQSLSTTYILGNIDPNYTNQLVGFPSAHFPSDHICLLAEFRIKESTS